MLTKIGDKIAEKILDEDWPVWPWLFYIVFVGAFILVGVIGE